MTKTTKIWLVAAVFLVTVGLIMFAAAMMAYDWDFAKLGTGTYGTNTYEISETFCNLSMNTDTADIIFALSDDGTCKVECFEEEKAKHSVTVQEDTLVIEVMEHKSWYDYIGIHFGTPRITVYLPQTEYTSLLMNESTGDIAIPKDFRFEDVGISSSTGDVDFFASASRTVSIKTSTGNICAENIAAGALDLSVSTGNVTVSGVRCEGDITVGVSTGKAYLTDIVCKNVISSGSTGDISLKNVIAAEKFSVERSTGDVTFEGSDAAEIFVETDTGDVTGNVLTDKVFITKTDTGKIKVPTSVTGGRCEIITDTGEINITVD